LAIDAGQIKRRHIPFAAEPVPYLGVFRVFGVSQTSLHLPGFGKPPIFNP